MSSTRKTSTALSVLAALGCLTVSGCTPNPCTTLAPPTPQELAVVASGAEVEREIGSTECDLVGDIWTRETS